MGVRFGELDYRRLKGILAPHHVGGSEVGCLSMLFVEVASHREEHELYFQFHMDLPHFMSANNAVGEKSFPIRCRSLLWPRRNSLPDLFRHSGQPGDCSRGWSSLCTVTTVRLTTV